nr:YceI family protein [Bacteroidota bacterium]
MKVTLNLIIIMLLVSTGVHAQKYMTKNGHISFFSSMPMEDIEAHNLQVNAALNTQTGDFVFKVLIKSFEFKKALMQEHFNENYMDSHKYPNATFQGKVTNLGEIDFGKDGEYPAQVDGKLTIHGVTQEVKETGVFIIGKGIINSKSIFNLMTADYNIKIPKAVINNIAESIELRVDVKLEPLK